MLILVFLFPGCDSGSFTSSSRHYHYSGATMGTTFTIKGIAAKNQLDYADLNVQIDGVLIDINQQMSSYIKDSELSRFNTSRTLDWVKISSDFYKVLKKSKEINDLSNQAFDVTVAPLINLWGFGTDPMNFQVPVSGKIVRAKANKGTEKIILQEKSESIRKELPELSIDLSAVAKGYAVDKIAELLNEYGFESFMVEIGGEIRLKGKNSSGNYWRIAIEKPSTDERSIQTVLSLTDISMATSGDYRNFFEKDGIHYSHTIDPRTGYPVSHTLASVTVLHDQCMDADAWATALMVLGPDKGYNLAEEQQLAVFFIIKTADGFKEIMTSRFREITEVKS